MSLMSRLKRCAVNIMEKAVLGALVIFEDPLDVMSVRDEPVPAHEPVDDSVEVVDAVAEPAVEPEPEPEEAVLEDIVPDVLNLTPNVVNSPLGTMHNLVEVPSGLHFHGRPVVFTTIEDFSIYVGCTLTNPSISGYLHDGVFLNNDCSARDETKKADFRHVRSILQRASGNTRGRAFNLNVDGRSVYALYHDRRLMVKLSVDDNDHKASLIAVCRAPKHTELSDQDLYIHYLVSQALALYQTMLSLHHKKDPVL